MNRRFFQVLQEGFQKCGIVPEIDLFWVRSLYHETRAIYDDGTINQLFQGYSKDKRPGMPGYFPGDNRMTLERDNAMQIQIHFIRPSNRAEITFYSPTIAVYLPIRYIDKLGKLVREND